MYVTYCKNKSQSETICREFTPYFEEIRSQLRDRLDLPDYLILPVQRITKYSLLLADFHKNSIRAGLEVAKIEAALRVTRGLYTAFTAFTSSHYPHTSTHTHTHLLVHRCACISSSQCTQRWNA